VFNTYNAVDRNIILNKDRQERSKSKQKKKIEQKQNDEEFESIAETYAFIRRI
jgi:hypothetical protein